MRVRILSVAEEDLEEGFRFYESQLPGLGSYFLDSLYSDIDSLAYFGGIHQVVFGYHRQLTSIWRQDYLISTDTRLKKQRWRRFFPAREKIDRVERDHG